MKTNKIYLGDCYKMIKDMPDKSIDLIYTDIPYLYTGLNPAKKEGSGNWLSKSISGMVKEISNFSNGIDMSILDEFVRVCKHIYVYIWCSREQIYPIMKFFIEKHNCLCEILTWHKVNVAPLLNNTWYPDTEYCLLFRERETTRLYGDASTKRKYYLSGTNKADKEDFKHPTIKPLQFVKDHIFNSTKEGDIVLDPFCGSGTTCLACKELKRQYIGIEVDPKWHQIAVDRMNGIDAYGQMSLLETDFSDLHKSEEEGYELQTAKEEK